MWWWITSVMLVVYVALGFVASGTNSADITLTPGTSATLTLFRLAQDRLRMELMFQGDHTKRPELGEYAQRPGSAIRIAASTPDAEPVVFQATAKIGWGSGTVFRDLTSDSSNVLGSARSSDTPQVVLPAGRTNLKIEVLSVEPPLVGETVQLLVHPALGFKSGMDNLSILWAGSSGRSC